MITAWLAMIVAPVARITIGSWPQAGTISKNGCVTPSRPCDSTKAPCPK